LKHFSLAGVKRLLNGPTFLMTADYGWGQDTS
jgi:hypothetical protein